MLKRFNKYSKIIENKKDLCYGEYDNPFIMTDSYKEDPHQAILDVGHCWLQKNIINSYGEMINKMKEDFGQEFALFILLGKYNQQVCNGGHSQYLDKGFASYERDRDFDLHDDMVQWLKSSDLYKSDIGVKVYNIMEKLNDVLGHNVSLNGEECEHCDGGQYEESCYDCSGSGVMEDNYDEDTDEFEEVDCDSCGGEGTVYGECEHCYGQGSISLIEENKHIFDKLDDDYYNVDDEWVDYMLQYSKKLVDTFIIMKSSQ